MTDRLYLSRLRFYGFPDLAGKPESYHLTDKEVGDGYYDP